jgi:uncharacterized repeat protein (TIGR03803 family)
MLAARHSHACPHKAADTHVARAVPSKGKFEKIMPAMRQFSCILSLLLAVTTLPAQTFTESVIYDFCSKANCADGEYPASGLVQAADGNFYGSTLGGNEGGCAREGLLGCGTIFRVTPSGVLTTIHMFCQNAFPNCKDGIQPQNLIQGSDGNFYGTTLGYDCGNSGNCGTIFKITSSGAFQTLYTFCSKSGCTDGGLPTGLTQGSDGNFYGATAAFDDPCTAGTAQCGTVFKITPTGKLTTLHTFCNEANCADGAGPDGGILQASDGDFYGTASGGGANGEGTLFQITLSGSFATTSNFGCPSSTDCYKSSGPVGNLLEDSNGALYGVTYAGGSGLGTIFEASTGTAGGATSLYTFCSTGLEAGGGVCSNGDGALPTSGLTLGTDGKLYGTTDNGGNSGNGVIYETGVEDEDESVIYTFCSMAIQQNGPCPSSAPEASLLQASDGNFWGTALNGGANGGGGVYKFSPSVVLSAPVEISLGSASVMPGKPVTATLKVLNAFSLTMQQCYAFQNGAPLGKVPGTYNSPTKLYTFSGSITPAQKGIYSYAVTCGGIESGFATLTVGDTTSTTLAASPNPVTPPANITLTATVTRTTGSGTPTGPVKFSVGTTVLGTAKLNESGVATLAASSSGIAAGTYPVVATYSGDSDDLGSASTAVDVTVK